MLTQWRKVFSIENIIQFDLEHRGDYVRLFEFNLGPIRGDRPTFTRPNFTYRGGGITKTILYRIEGEGHIAGGLE